MGASRHGVAGGMTRILLVCMANICRSPMAASVLRQMVCAAGLSAGVAIDAAGIHAQPDGKRPDARALQALAARHYRPGKSRSRQITRQDFERFDMVLAMDSTNLAALQAQCPPQHRHKLSLFLAFATGLGESEVPDPYYGNQAGFERVMDLCEAGACGLLKQLR